MVLRRAQTLLYKIVLAAIGLRSLDQLSQIPGQTRDPLQ